MSVPRITKEDLKQQLDGGAAPVLVDARLKYPVRAQHGASARRDPLSGRRHRAVQSRAIARSSCTTPTRTSSPVPDVAAELIRQGYRAAALKGGIVDWLEANLPTETKDAPQMAPPAPGALKG